MGSNRSYPLCRHSRLMADASDLPHSVRIPILIHLAALDSVQSKVSIFPHQPFRDMSAPSGLDHHAVSPAPELRHASLVPYVVAFVDSPTQKFPPASIRHAGSAKNPRLRPMYHYT